MHLNVDKYMPMLDRYDLSKAQKLELLHSLWNITGRFVDRAFGISSLQVPLKKKQKPNLQDSDKSLDLEISKFLTEQFERTATPGEGVQSDE